MTDQDRPRRHGEGSAPDSGADDPRRFFTGPGDPAPEGAGPSRPAAPSGNRHRRRRGPGDPTTTGSIPIVRVDRTLPDPTIEYRTPEPPAGGPSPYFEVRYQSSTEPGLSFTEPRTEPVPPVTGPPAYTPAARPPDEPALPEEPAFPTEAAPPVEATGEPGHRFAAPQPLFDDILDSPEPLDAREPLAAPQTRATPEYIEPTDSGRFDVLDGSPGVAPMETPVPLTARDREPAPLDEGLTEDLTDTDEHPVVGGAMPARKRRRGLLLGVAALALIVVLVVGGLGLKWLGVFDSREDFSSTTGSGAVLVEVPEQAAIRDVGQRLADVGVVGSRRAYVDAAQTADAVSPGFYRLPRGLSAEAAVGMMTDGRHRVGHLVVPEGLQLDSKKGVDDKTTPGIFQMVADATTFTTDDGQFGVSVEQLTDAAAKATPDQLGVPEWARPTVEKLTGDHRRIEGLIASGAWEDIDPSLDATQVLREMITRSVSRFTAWGLLGENHTGKTPYETLVIASIVEREARKDEDFPKVARVIVNRLDKGQRLEMDSTANYTAAVTNIDLHGEAYTDANEWNTYHHKGLSVTPIGAVGEKALRATEDPAQGRWLYFVTVDKNGTTLFANTFEQHKRNREVACRNRFLTTGCE